MINRVLKKCGSNCKCDFNNKVVNPDLKILDVNLENLPSKKWTLIFFVPKLNTGLCDDEINDFNNHYNKFKKMGVKVYGVSTDPLDVTTEFMNNKKISFSLISDDKKNLSKWFNIFEEDKGVSLRGTYIISPEKKVFSELNTNMYVGRNIQEIVRLTEASIDAYKGKPIFCKIK